MLSYFGCDQSQVQRYLSGSSLTQSRLSLLFNAFLKVPMQFLILLTGVLVFVFYHFQPPPLLWNPVELAQARAARAAGRARRRCRQRFEAAQAARRAAAEAYARARDAGATGAGARGLPRAAAAARARARGRAAQLVEARHRTAAATTTPTTSSRPTSSPTCRAAWPGLVIAVIFAAAMSTLSGEFNSLATATMVDFYKRFVSAVRRRCARPADVAASSPRSGASSPAWSRCSAGQLGSAIEVVNRFGSYFYGSILGVFGLAVLTPRATARGAFYGLLARDGHGLRGRRGSPRSHFLWYNVVGAVTVFVVGLAITAVSGQRQRVGNA